MLFKTNFKKIARKKLLHDKQEDIAVFEFLEAYLTERIIDGEDFRKPDLAGIQRKIEETNKFVEFLKKI